MRATMVSRLSFRLIAGLVLLVMQAACSDPADTRTSLGDARRPDAIDPQGSKANDASVSPDSSVPKRDSGAGKGVTDAAEQRPATSGPDDTIVQSDGGSPAVSNETDAASPTHGRLDEPNYEVAFPKTKVNELTITLTPESWQAMLDDMTRLWGPRGGTGRPPSGGQPGGDTLGGFPSEDPAYASATISFNGLTWNHVGIRFKGNSSLRAAWSSNSDRFPFRVDFDEYEELHPEVKNQRFYGFKTLSLSNNTGDATQMREVLYYDLAEQAGLVTPARSFYEIFLDRGQGRKSLGLYTTLEVIKEGVIPRHFNDPSGSLFKATGTASNLAANGKAAIPNGFEKEGGLGRKEADADWAELEVLHDALHAPTRTSDAAAWRTRLEALFDVPSYLRWLALSALFQHWDTYGRMPHNYYLYNDPISQKFHWISWDHNFVLGASPGGGGSFGNLGVVPFDKTNVGATWPLITFLYADASYRDTYDAALADLIEKVFEPSKANTIIDRYGAVLMPYATKGGTAASYTQALQALKDAVKRQATAARTYLGQ